MAEKRGRTRDRIIEVAMRMFVEQGYDSTSLREIAEELEVTKAALYYHFRTKEDIVAEAFAVHAHQFDELMGWLSDTEPSPERDAELIDRLDALFSGESGLVLRFMQVNQAVMSREDFGGRDVDVTSRMISALIGDTRDVEGRLRTILAFGAMALAGTAESPGIGLMLGGTAAERRSAGHTIARELLAALHTTAPGTDN